MLAPFADNVWCDSREGTFLGVECGARMTVLRLGDGGLFVHSPVALDDATRRAIGELGPVRAVVAPSIFHHLHVGDWMRDYPDATFAACPGLECKRPDLAFDSVLGDAPHSAWAADVEQVYFSARRENEVVFFHEKSRTMICADALLNLSTHRALSTRVVAKLMRNDAPGTGWGERFMIRNRTVARRQADRILEWDFERAVLAHGEPVDRDGKAVFRHAYAWL